MNSRRDFLATSMSAFTMYALLAEVRGAHGSGRSMDAHAWLARQDAIAKSLAAGELRPAQWQTEIEVLAKMIDVASLRAVLDRAERRDIGRGSPNDPFKRSVVFRDEAGQRRALHYGVALFDFERDNVITPHGHRHMVWAHLVLDGALRVRNFDRLRDEDGAMILRPTRDAVVREGEVSSMSSERDNVHWFVPASARATTFDVVVSDLDRGEPSFEIQAVDPLAAERLADGTLRTPIIDFHTASQRYTRDV